MFATIPFTIEIKSKEYNGYLQVRDFTEPPVIFWVFFGNMIVGELSFADKWIFDQGQRFKTIGKLSDQENEFAAEYLGNIVMIAHQ